ncbi:Spx/MgsR family RNA polymerase-binding regulatory protein [Enterococcus hirae]|nr:Spx/MgsR family RNA polymerase-binding regulatory protein [Enterococcus hirae]
MIIVYTTVSCTACRQAIKWFTDNNILFSERKIQSNNPFTKVELKEILFLTENGWEDLICKRSNVYKFFVDEFEEYTLERSIEFVIAHPNILKKPIIMDEKKVRAGFNTTVLRSFIPRKRRKKDLAQYYINSLDII